jgi:hypothetical protein
LNALLPEHESQVINYLYATGFKLGLLFNFGNLKIGIKRIANLDGPVKYNKRYKPTKNTEYTE